MRRLALAALAATAAACSCGGSDGPSPVPPRTASPLPGGALRGVGAFSQRVPAEDALGEVFPGAANSWVLDRDFSLSLGYGLQYDTALQLWAGRTRPPPSSDPAAAFDQLVSDWIDSAGTTALLHDFPYDQRAAEAVWLTPLFGAADGLVAPVATASPAIAGTSALLPGGADSRLVRTLTLAAGQAYTLAWEDDVVPSPGRLAGGAAPPDGPRWQVVLRDPATGALLGEPLFLSTAATPFAGSRSASFTAGAGAVPAGAVDLSFELRSGASLDALAAGALVDAVALSTVGGPVPLANGDFEAGTLAPWRALAAREPRNVRSGARLLAVDPAGATTLAVTRALYAPPSASWARMTDVFENGGDVEVVTTVVYVTAGAAGGTTAWLGAADGRAVVGRDTTSGQRDFGLVFGTGTARFDAASGTPDLLFVVHPLRVPAHGRAALVHFVVQLGQGGTLSGTDHVPSGTGVGCQRVADGVRTSPEYLLDLEPGVLPAVQNL